jgi:glycogen debranching enzyme
MYLLSTMRLGYSPANSPHLTPAFELDSAIIQFSDSLTAKSLPTEITSETDLTVIIDALNDTLKALDLWQFYVLNVQRERDNIRTTLQSGSYKPWSGLVVTGKSVVDLAEIIKDQAMITGLGALTSRFGVYVDPHLSASLIQAAFADVQDVDALADAWIRVVDVVNVPLYLEWEEDMKAAVGNLKNRVRYMRLENHGPKLGKISRE